MAIVLDDVDEGVRIVAVRDALVGMGDVDALAASVAVVWTAIPGCRCRGDCLANG